MALDTLVDPLFRVPFFTGLVLAPLAALLGTWLRLREEWLAAMAYAQVAAAGGVLGAVLNLALVPAALAIAAVAAVVKGLAARAGNDHFALFMLLGWGLTLLVAANSAHGEMVGRALLDGQLYFTGPGHLWAGATLLALTLALLPWLAPRLLLSRFFPEHFAANGLPAWRHKLVFDLLVVMVVALTTTAVGVMATFALVFIPPWIAFALARGWRPVMVWSALLALGAYLIAFAGAILLDQPFGPVLTLVLASLAVLRLARRARNAT